MTQDQPPAASTSSLSIVELGAARRAPFADNPTNGLIPLPATEVFLQRLTGWGQLVKRMIAQYELILDSQKRLADVHGKCAREFGAAIRTKDNSEDVFGEGELAKSLFTELHQTHHKLHTDSLASASILDTQVLPNLRALFAEIRKKATDADKEWTDMDKELEKDRNEFVRLRGYLKGSLTRHKEEGVNGKPAGPEGSKDVGPPKDQPADPWVACQNLRRHTTICLNKQKSYRSELAAQCDNFAAFETTLIENLRLALASFVDWRVKDLTTELDAFKSIKTRLFSVEPKRDWDAFKERHLDRIVERGLPLVLWGDLKPDLDEYGWSDPMTTILKEGILLAKDSKAWRRKYHERKVVLTKGGFLHVMPDGEPGKEAGKGKYDEAPETSLELKDCVIGPLMANEKEPEEFVLIERGGGFLGREVKHKFRGNTLDESAEWWGLLSQRVRTTVNRLDVVDSPTTPSAPSLGDGTIPTPTDKKRSWLPSRLTKTGGGSGAAAASAGAGIAAGAALTAAADGDAKSPASANGTAPALPQVVEPTPPITPVAVTPERPMQPVAEVMFQSPASDGGDDHEVEEAEAEGEESPQPSLPPITTAERPAPAPAAAWGDPWGDPYAVPDEKANVLGLGKVGTTGLGKGFGGFEDDLGGGAWAD
ncbi:hypothetical protein HDV00_007982 [Rhizophlyctis rosea]|nr:hypothetical protein HDV00_007982 [Rhizophlyctis rosea]